MAPQEFPLPEARPQGVTCDEQKSSATTTTNHHPREGHLLRMRHDHQDAHGPDPQRQGLRGANVLSVVQPAFPHAGYALLELGAVGVIRSIASGLLFAAPAYFLLYVLAGG